MSIISERNLDLQDEKIRALIEASTIITSTLELDEALERILERAKDVMEAEASSVILVDRATDEMVFEAVTGDKSDVLKELRFKKGEGIAGWVVEKGKPVIVPDVSTDTRWFKEIDRKTQFHTKSILCAPLKVKDKVIGVVEVLNKKDGNSFGEEDLNVFMIFTNLAAIAIENARLYGDLELENTGLKTSLRTTEEIVVGESGKVKAILGLVKKVSESNSTVLLTGESGTGKEVIARLIHKSGPRRDKPFIQVNCAALPENLLESELFGHEKGAFTGAILRKMGRFELAQGGTLFLDEVGEVSQAVQMKLLRVLESGEFERLGGIKTLRSNARIIVATNKDLNKAIKEGAFREDLYYRLNVVPIELPPLRERRIDIPIFVDSFIKRFNKELNKDVTGISDKALEVLCEYSWPGNIRELKNIIERVIVLIGTGKIELGDLPAEIRTTPNKFLDERIKKKPLDRSTLWEMEKEIIEKELRDSGWNQSKAARALGISRDNLRYRVKKFAIKVPKE